MKEVSREQALEVMAKLQTNVDWGDLDPEVIQRIIDDPTGSGREFTRFLQNRGRLQVVTAGGTVPVGGKIQTVSVPVDESRDWNEAVRAAGPDTSTGYAVWKVGDQYPPIVGAAIRQEIILVNFGKYMSSEDVLKWGKEYRLRPATPRACLAVGEHRPTLHRDLGLDYMAVVSLAPCSFEGGRSVCGVWWRGSGREARLSWFGLGWDDGCWFALVREL